MPLISSTAPEIILFKVTPRSLASDFASSTFKVTESLPYLTSQDVWLFVGPDPSGPHCHVAEPRVACFTNFSTGVFPNWRPRRAYWDNQQHIKYCSFSLLPYLFLYQCLVEK